MWILRIFMFCTILSVVRVLKLRTISWACRKHGTGDTMKLFAKRSFVGVRGAERRILLKLNMKT